MKKIIPILIVIFALAVCIPQSFAQEDKPIVNDYDLWMSIGVSYKIKKLKFELEQASRLDDTISTVYRNFTQFSVGYKLTKWASVSTGFRNTYDKEGYRRIFGAIKLDENIKKFDFILRTKLEHTYEFLESESNNTRLRNSLKVKYTKYDFQPSVFAEIFHPIRSGLQFEPINRFRYGVKSSYKFNKQIELNIGIFNNDLHKKKKIKRDLVFKIGANYKL